jgi:hypothetical protein
VLPRAVALQDAFENPNFEQTGFSLGSRGRLKGCNQALSSYGSTGFRDLCSPATAAPTALRAVVVPAALHPVVVQVAFESKGLKPGYHLIGSTRVETRRLSSCGSTTGFKLYAPHHAKLCQAASVQRGWRQCRNATSRCMFNPMRSTAIGVEVEALGPYDTSGPQRSGTSIHPFESKGLKPPGYHHCILQAHQGLKPQTRRFQDIYMGQLCLAATCSPHRSCCARTRRRGRCAASMQRHKLRLKGRTVSLDR